jgi:transposase-like protein
VILVPEALTMQAQDDHRNKMLELARQWQESGTTARAFAQEHGITTWTLYYWRHRLPRQDRRAHRRRRSRPVRLAPVHVMRAAEDLGSDLDILLASGDRVRVSARVSVETLRRVVQVLRAAC